MYGHLKLISYLCIYMLYVVHICVVVRTIAATGADGFMYVLCAQILDDHILDAHELKKMLAEKEKRAKLMTLLLS